MENWLIGIMNEYGYAGILLLIAFENVFPPVPSEVILTFGGFLTTTTNLSIVGVVISATAGSVIGAAILYSIGLQLDVEKLERIIDKWGRFLRITKKDIYKADAWFDKYGPWTVFLCRFVPLIRSLISIPAGMSNMKISVFLVLTTLGTLLWNIILIYLGASLGGSWETVVAYIEVYARIIYVLLALSMAILFIIYIKKRRR